MRAFVYVVLLLWWCDGSQAQHHPNNLPDRQAIVHLFEWRWDDIALECERFLGPYGFAGVQVSPPNENVIVWSPDWNQEVKRPWFERYQPVSYKLETRSGSEEQFQDMVQRCNRVGVRIYVDVVVNHMTGFAGSGTGTGGSYYDSGSKQYDGVPYSSRDFHGPDQCPTASGNIESYQDPVQVRNCALLGLADLNQGKEYVREKIQEYLNKLMSYGVAGFRIDAAKHMWPGDLNSIFRSLSTLPTYHGFPPDSKPFIYQEVIDMGGEPITGWEYAESGRVSEFKYGMYLGQAFRRRKQLKWLNNFGEGWAMLPSDNALVFVDNHDNQRGHGGGGDMILTFRDPRLYKMANAFMLAWPYGFVRLMSSYDWDRKWVNGQDANNWVGPPHDLDWNILGQSVNDDMTCGNGWICEHRWRQIYNMVSFRNTVSGEGVNDWWDNGNNQISFCRGNKGFIAINNEDYGLEQSLQTCLPQGSYCDVISGSLVGGHCTGKTVTIDVNGKANIYLSNTDEDGVIAISIDSKAAGNPVSPSTTPVPTATAPSLSHRRTVIFLKKVTIMGESVFIAGGISHGRRPGCTYVADTSACSIPIRHNQKTLSASYEAWKVGDNYLDWYGAELRQDKYYHQGLLREILIHHRGDDQQKPNMKQPAHEPDHQNASKVITEEADASRKQLFHHQLLKTTHYLDKRLTEEHQVTETPPSKVVKSLKKKKIWRPWGKAHHLHQVNVSKAINEVTDANPRNRPRRKLLEVKDYANETFRVEQQLTGALPSSVDKKLKKNKTRNSWKQGMYNGIVAKGTPMFWTSSDESNVNYNPLNTLGDHYWMVDVQMDCSKTEDGWFELKGIMTDGSWERDRTQGECGGSAGGQVPYPSINHLGRCGYVNIFRWDEDDCIINTF